MSKTWIFCASKYSECVSKCANPNAPTLNAKHLSNMRSPFAQNESDFFLLKTNYITVSTNASSLDIVKMMPVIAHYFIPTISVCAKSLEF